MVAVAQEIMQERQHDLDTRLTSHEAVCAIRYQTIAESLARQEHRTNKIEKMLLTVVGSILIEVLIGSAWLLIEYVKTH